MRKLVGVLVLAAVLSAAASVGANATARGTNGRMAFTVQVGSHTQLFTIRSDGTRLTQLTHFKDGSDALNANWSPDGKRIVFERDYPHPRAVVETMAWNGADQKVLTPEAAKGTFLYESNPSWSPDGRLIAFTRNVAYTRDNNGPRDNSEVWVMTAGGKDRRRVSPFLASGPNGDHFVAHSQFAPDGKRLVFVKLLGSRSALFVIGLNGRGLRRLTPWSLGVDDRVDWSPDGSLILFSNARDDAHGVVSNVYTIRPDGSGLRQITHEKNGSGVSDKADSWAPDGTQIMFVRRADSTSSLFVMNADGSGAKQLTHGLDVHGGSWGTHP